MAQLKLPRKSPTIFLNFDSEDCIMTRQNTELNTVELVAKDFGLAANLLADAFFDNPAHVYIFADQSSRLKALQWELKANLKLNLSQPTPIGKSFALVEANKPPGNRQIKAMAFWNTSNSRSISFVSKIKTGLLTFPFRYGWQTWQHLSEIMSAIEEIKEKTIGQSPAWYLNNMVVAKQIRGIGIGTKLLNHQLQSVVVPSNFPVVLMARGATCGQVLRV